jgi:hypothetical protein
VSPRPLVSVSALTIADYLLWTWSVSTNHEVISLLAGLTLLPLLLAAISLLVLHAARRLTERARRRAAQAVAAHEAAAARRERAGQNARQPKRPLEQAPVSSPATAETRSRTIAA